MTSTLDGQAVLVTGGTGSFGKAFVARALRSSCTRVVIYSRDELKQHEMRFTLDDPRLRFFIGDVRDEDRLRLAMQGVHVVVHAAALKQVPACEYNPTEAVATNVIGSENVIMAALRTPTVERVVGLSTDKACQPVTLYGSTKLVAERLFIAANSFASGGRPRFAATRYGNVAGSRGSVIPLFKMLAGRGEPLPVTHAEMTRFYMTLDESVDLVLLALREMRGGEVFIPKLPAFRVLDLADALHAPYTLTGIRAGEKVHESLISPDEMRSARDYGDHYRLLPTHHPWCSAGYVGGVPCDKAYTSDGVRLLTAKELEERIA